MKKIEQIEVVQAENKEKLDAQDEAIKKNAGKMEEMEKKSNKMEKRLKNVEGETPNIRQTNAVIREIREMEPHLVIKSLEKCTKKCKNS